MKRALLILAAIGYFIFFVEGLDTGLGLYRTPSSCWTAAGCAAVAMACCPKRRRWLWSIAGIAAIAGSLYGYHENAKWRAIMDRVQRHHVMPPASRTETNR